MVASEKMVPIQLVDQAAEDGSRQTKFKKLAKPSPASNIGSLTAVTNLGAFVKQLLGRAQASVSCRVQAPGAAVRGARCCF